MLASDSTDVGADKDVGLMPSSQWPPSDQLEVTILGTGYFRFFLNLSKVKRCPGLIHCTLFDVL